MSDKQDENLYQVVVFNKTGKEGYRRAGVSLLKGANLLKNVTQAQIEQFKADPRLVFGSQDPMPTESTEETEQRLLSEVHSDHSSPQGASNTALPDDLTVEQIKALLTEQGVHFSKSAKKAELIALWNAAQNGADK